MLKVRLLFHIVLLEWSPPGSLVPCMVALGFRRPREKLVVLEMGNFYQVHQLL